MIARSDGTAALKEDRRYTYRDYRTWPENERWELLHGTAYAMSPAPRRDHQGLVIRIATRIAAHLEDAPCKLYAAPIDVFFPAVDEPLDEVDVVLQPDVVVVCDPAKLVPEGIRGAPDLIVEVISPASAMRDQTEKRLLYEAAGVREYWIANPNTLEVLVYSLLEGKFGLPVPGTLIDGVAVGIFPGLIVRAQLADL